MTLGIHGARGRAVPSALQRILHTAVRWGSRLALLAVALVFAASALVVILLTLAWWAARVAWLKLTGRPAVPFVMRVQPRNAFRGAWQPRGDERVVDVQARPLP